MQTIKVEVVTGGFIIENGEDRQIATTPEKVGLVIVAMLKRKNPFSELGLGVVDFMPTGAGDLTVAPKKYPKAKAAPRSFKRWMATEIAEMMELRKQMTVKKIAKRLGRSPHAVSLAIYNENKK